jgi:hypothetical protein
MTKPTELPTHHQEHLHDLLTACAHLTTLAERVKQFAGLLTERRGHDLDAWMNTADADDLPALHGFVHGLRMDLPAVVAGLTLPYSNGPIEGANTKVKFLKRQMYGRAGFALLRQRICSHETSRHHRFCARAVFLTVPRRRQLTLRLRHLHEALRDARAEQQTDAWKQTYRARAGIEGTIHQATRSHRHPPSPKHRSRQSRP